MNKLDFVLALLFLLTGCGQPKNKTNDKETGNDTQGGDTKTTAIIKEAYIYGLPLILMDITRRQMTDPATAASYAPPNQFRHNSSFPDASFKNVVRPNADTYYSIAWLDLSQEPVILSVPDTKGRYYMIPMMDAYSNVFSSPGTRTTGNHADNFIVSGPQWTGQNPKGMNAIQSPTNTVWIIGRTQVNSKEDGARNVVPLQNQYKLIPLSQWAKSSIASKTSVESNAPKGDPNAIIKNMPIEEYFNYVNQLLAKNPAPSADKTAMDGFATIGVGAGKKFDLNAFPIDIRTAIIDIPKTVFSTFDSEKASSDNLVNGWNMGRKVIGTYGTDYYSRASVAYFGLGANLREDAIYPSTYFDSEGKQLNGGNSYLIRFGKGTTPPANAFWSLTMYDPEGYFVDNTINRYTLGDRSNLKTNSDGSMDIYIQRNNPGPDKSRNWLPAPPGDFNLLLRIYWPKDEVINGSWAPPPVVKLVS